ncbi:aspartate aminotransferase family protein [Nocardia sp. NPDC052278]|uniref:aspartate aminotransferase family protein n=1 Tax=unclassified Nocardia TaxID=2637762 RepID=UPI00367EF7E5
MSHNDTDATSNAVADPTTGIGHPNEQTTRLLAAAQRTTFPARKPASLVIEYGRGRHVMTVDGHRYLDFTAGNAVSCLGYAHPAITAAIAEQAARIVHTSNLVHNRQAILLAEQLCQRTPFDRVFFCNSGSEANECLLKLARRHFHEQGQDRTQIISTNTGFHGRTYGALTLTGRTKHKIGTGPLLAGVTHVRFNSLDAAAATISADTAAVIVETIQAEAGVIPADDHYLQGLRELCDHHGALLMFDEVQTGICRTGPFLSCEHSSVIPDACSLAKGIASGLPMGAVLARETLAGALPPGSHASTFGGNPVAAAAARATLEVIDTEDIPGNVERSGRTLASRLRELAADDTLPVTAARGTGLLQGLELSATVDPQHLLGQLREQGLLLTVVAERVLRFTPPLNLTADELEWGLDTLHSVLRRHR